MWRTEEEELAVALEGGAVKVLRDTAVPHMSNIRREQSAPPDANAEPSELNDTECTASVCPCSTATCLPLPTSHRHTDPVSVPAASRLDVPEETTAEDSATQHRGEGLPLKRRTHLPDLKSHNRAVLSSAQEAIKFAFSCQHTAVTSLVCPVKSLRGAVRSVQYTAAVMSYGVNDIEGMRGKVRCGQIRSIMCECLTDGRKLDMLYTNLT